MVLKTVTLKESMKTCSHSNLSFSQGIVDGGLNGTKTMKMQCFPFYTLLLALGNPTVDFLSLDIEVSICLFDAKQIKLFQKGSRVGGSANYSMDKGAFSFLPDKLGLKVCRPRNPI